MQDFTKYDYTITAEQLTEAVKHGFDVTIIINGEYYDFRTTKGESEK